jgi:hypothetical protein
MVFSEPVAGRAGQAGHQDVRGDAAHLGESVAQIGEALKANMQRHRLLRLEPSK